MLRVNAPGGEGETRWTRYGAAPRRGETPLESSRKLGTAKTRRRTRGEVLHYTSERVSETEEERSLANLLILCVARNETPEYLYRVERQKSQNCSARTQFFNCEKF